MLVKLTFYTKFFLLDFIFFCRYKFSIFKNLSRNFWNFQIFLSLFAVVNSAKIATNYICISKISVFKVSVFYLSYILTLYQHSRISTRTLTKLAIGLTWIISIVFAVMMHYFPMGDFTKSKVRLEAVEFSCNYYTIFGCNLLTSM